MQFDGTVYFSFSTCKDCIIVHSSLFILPDCPGGGAPDDPRGRQRNTVRTAALFPAQGSMAIGFGAPWKRKPSSKLHDWYDIAVLLLTLSILQSARLFITVVGETTCDIQPLILQSTQSYNVKKWMHFTVFHGQLVKSQTSEIIVFPVYSHSWWLNNPADLSKQNSNFSATLYILCFFSVCL